VIRVLAITLLIAGCASNTPQHYRRLPWANTSIGQAIAQCEDEINRDDSSGSMYLCMRKRGWQEVP
jgi:hypothetical protein